MQVGYPLICR